MRESDRTSGDSKTRRLWRTSAERLESRPNADPPSKSHLSGEPRNPTEPHQPRTDFLSSLTASDRLCAARMRGKQASVCTGCWRPVLLSCVLVLHLVPPAVHGENSPRTLLACKNMHINCRIFVQQQHILSENLITLPQGSRKEVSEAPIVG